MTVSTDLGIIYIQQSKPLDDTLWSQVIAVMDVGFNEVEGLVLRAEALHRHTHWLYHADGVGQLDFALVCVAGLSLMVIKTRMTMLLSLARFWAKLVSATWQKKKTFRFWK